MGAQKPLWVPDLILWVPRHPQRDRKSHPWPLVICGGCPDRTSRQRSDTEAAAQRRRGRCAVSRDMSPAQTSTDHSRKRSPRATCDDVCQLPDFRLPGSGVRENIHECSLTLATNTPLAHSLHRTTSNHTRQLTTMYIYTYIL